MAQHYMQERVAIVWWPRTYQAYGRVCREFGLKFWLAVGDGVPPLIPAWERALIAVLRKFGHPFFVAGA